MLTVREIHPLFGAEIAGISLQEESTPRVAAQIRETLTRYGVVVLREQGLSDDALQEFGFLLGEVYRPSQLLSRKDNKSCVFRLSNIGENGDLLPANDRARAVHVANQLWHTDSTYLRPRAEFSLLAAHIIPPHGGETEFCDMRVAYEGLPAATRATADRSIVHHSILHSRALTGYRDWTAEEIGKLPPIRRPLVHLHQDTGRTVLCLASHISDIEGYTPEASQSFVDMLIDEVTRPERIYTHSWSVGDLLIWDNRCMMHRARPFDDEKYGRDMRSLRTVDTADA